MIDRFRILSKKFTQFESIIQKLESNKIYFLIGGSASLYIQGNPRLPHDIDLMFTRTSHKQANSLFDIPIEFIRRPNVTMYKSTPVNDNSIDFLSQYTVIDNGQKFQSNPVDKVDLTLQGTSYGLVPVEKIVIFKLIGRRLHHKDIEDVKSVLHNCDFHTKLFWKFVDQQKAKNDVKELIREFKLVELGL